MILVTGGLGFIGYNLIKELLEKGYRPISLDNGSNSVVNEIRGIKNYHGDIKNFKLLRKVTKDVGEVFHLAAQTKVPLSVEDPIYDFEINALGTLNLLEACRINDVKRVIFSSSAAIYGDPKDKFVSEDVAKNPKSPYGLSKLVAENYLRIFHELYGLETIILRYFNVYGLEKKNNVIGMFIERIKKNLPLIIYGDGSQIRDFVYVKDVVDASLLALNKGRPGDAYNIGTGKETSVEELKDLMIKLRGKRLGAIYKPARIGGVRGNIADISKARRELGYEPKYDLENGLKATIDWFKS